LGGEKWGKHHLQAGFSREKKRRDERGTSGIGGDREEDLGGSLADDKGDLIIKKEERGNRKGI